MKRMHRFYFLLVITCLWMGFVSFIACEKSTIPDRFEASPGTFVRGFVAGTVSGGNGIPNVRIVVENSDIETYSDSYGFYEIQAPDGVYFSILATKEGHAYTRVQDVVPLSKGQIMEDVNFLLHEQGNVVPINDPSGGTSYNQLSAPLLEISGISPFEKIEYNNKRDIISRCRAANPIAAIQSASTPHRLSLGVKWFPGASGAIAGSSSDLLFFKWDSQHRSVGETYIHVSCIDMNYNRVEKTIPIEILPIEDAPSKVPVRVNTNTVALSGITFGDERRAFFRKSDAIAQSQDSDGNFLQNPVNKNWAKYVFIFWDKMVESRGYRIYRSDNGPDGTYKKIKETIQTQIISLDPCSGNPSQGSLADNRPNCDPRLQTIDWDPDLEVGKTYYYKITSYNAYGEGPASFPKSVQLLPPYWVTLLGPGSNGSNAGESTNVNDPDSQAQSLPVIDILRPVYEWEATPCPGADVRVDYLYITPVTEGHYGWWGNGYPNYEPNTQYNYFPEWAYPRDYARFEFDPVKDLNVQKIHGTQNNGDCWLTAVATENILDKEIRYPSNYLEPGTIYEWNVQRSVAIKKIPTTYYAEDGVTITDIVYDGTCNSYSYPDPWGGGFLDGHFPWNGPLYFTVVAGGKPAAPSFVSCPVPTVANTLIYLEQFGGAYQDIETRYMPLDKNSDGLIVLFYGGFLFQGNKILDPQISGYHLYYTVGSPGPEDDLSRWIQFDDNGNGTTLTRDGVVYTSGPYLGTLSPYVIPASPGSVVYVRLTTVNLNGLESDPTDTFAFKVGDNFKTIRPPATQNLRLKYKTSTSVTLEWDPIDRDENPIFGGYYGITISTEKDGQNYLPKKFTNVLGVEEDVPNGTLIGFTNKSTYEIDLEKYFFDVKGKSFFIRVYGIDTNLNPNGLMEKAIDESMDSGHSWLRSNEEFAVTIE